MPAGHRADAQRVPRCDRGAERCQNAAYLAVAILAVADDALADKLDAFRADTAAAIAKKDAAVAAEAAAL